MGDNFGMVLVESMGIDYILGDKVSPGSFWIIRWPLIRDLLRDFE